MSEVNTMVLLPLLPAKVVLNVACNTTAEGKTVEGGSYHNLPVGLVPDEHEVLQEKRPSKFYRRCGHDQCPRHGQDEDDFDGVP
jgi:Ni,Fe-hydrogenase I small subunit